MPRGHQRDIEEGEEQSQATVVRQRAGSDDGGDLDFPTNGGHSVKGVYSPLEVHQWREHDAPTPRSSRLRPSGLSPSTATPSPRPHAPSASPRTSSATGSKPSTTTANAPSRATATSPPSRKRSGASVPTTSGCWRSVTS